MAKNNPVSNTIFPHHRDPIRIVPVDQPELLRPLGKGLVPIAPVATPVSIYRGMPH